MKMHSFNQYSHDVGAAVHDLWLTARVKSSLEMAGATRGQHVRVRTHAGVVTLSGHLETHHQCDLAASLARLVPGVSAVDASGLEVWTVAPGQMPEAGDAEEHTELSAEETRRRERQRNPHSGDMP